jgi:hypothetical protein
MPSVKKRNRTHKATISAKRKEHQEKMDTTASNVPLAQMYKELSPDVPVAPSILLLCDSRLLSLLRKRKSNNSLRLRSCVLFSDLQSGTETAARNV